MWCVATGMAPDVYYRLSLIEQNEFVHAANKLRGR